MILIIYGNDYIKLQDIEIMNNSIGWGVLVEHDRVNVEDAATHIELTGLEIHHTGGEAIQVRGNVANVLIHNCLVHDSERPSGIDIYQWDGGRPRHITVSNCIAYNFPEFAGIASEQADHLIIDKNVSYNNKLGIDIGSGDNNIIRENVTINRATIDEDATRLGNNNAILAYCHIAHDCVLGSNIIISNVSTLAGHCLVEDNAGLGGYVGVHQFVKIGKMAYVGGWSKVVKDVPPFIKVSGTPLKVYGLNSVGLERNKVSTESKQSLRKAYNILYRSKNNVSQAVAKIRELPQTDEVADLLAFLENTERGIAK